ncbi:phenolic acid decarboxylase [Pantoea rodasii]|uniref:phenolic acid decarboxylase n=1 Tax=Pantoea rodasii TaxID=1076549 RepID=UPI001F0B94C6|nr:phenolic acid decarboxylase [Pantoea rodasii]
MHSITALDPQPLRRDAKTRYVVIPEFSKVTYMKNEGPDNDEVINMPPGQLPSDFFDNK